MAKKTVVVGSTVRLTGKFLRSTGQQVGGEGTKRWQVLGIHGSLAEVNEPSAYQFTDEEYEADPSLKNRRIHVGNLEVCK